MPRFKQFQGTAAELEVLVNEWLEEFEPDVTLMSQTVAGAGALTVCFLYDESFRGQERRLDNEHGMAAAASMRTPEALMQEDTIQVRITPPEQGPEPDTGA